MTLPILILYRTLFNLCYNIICPISFVLLSRLYYLSYANGSPYKIFHFFTDLEQNNKKIIDFRRVDLHFSIKFIQKLQSDNYMFTKNYSNKLFLFSSIFVNSLKIYYHSFPSIQSIFK